MVLPEVQGEEGAVTLVCTWSHPFGFSLMTHIPSSGHSHGREPPPASRHHSCQPSCLHPCIHSAQLKSPQLVHYLTQHDLGHISRIQFGLNSRHAVLAF